MSAEEKAENEESAWLVRPYMSHDEAAVLYMLRVGYTRSRAGYRAGAERAGGSRAPDAARGAPDPEAVQRQRAFMEAHQPVWAWLLENADISLAVDRESPQIIWGWAITSRPNVIHAVGVKRNAIDAGLGPDIVHDLLGDRFHTHQVCTLELPQMRTRGGSHAIGLDRPRDWSMDPTWLVTRMVGS